jgi:O-acetyl-ADP-ribose deacetylase (regulator of RNase III)
MIEFVQGDLFVNHYEVQTFAHGCNCRGVMGAGIAAEFKRRYPEMFREYAARCTARPRRFSPGDVFLWKPPAGPAVFNLATQDRPGPYATVEAIEQSLRAMRQLADREGITSIAMPAVGAGVGGLAWPALRTVAERVFGDWSGRLVVYEEYVRGAVICTLIIAPPGLLAPRKGFIKYRITEARPRCRLTQW